jgi:hypothetical protein
MVGSPPRRRSVLVVFLAALGLYAAMGVVDFVGDATSVTRVAMLPPLWVLVALLAGTGVTVYVVSRRRADAADGFVPLVLLGALALPLMPWLPERVSALSIFAGPAKLLLLIVAGTLVEVPVAGWIGPRLVAGLNTVVVFGMSVLVFGVVAWRLTGTPVFPAGDEPHYLVMTQSLITDGDFQIENNHAREDYRAYFDRPLKPDYLTRGTNGQIYSIHPMGLPVIAVPAFALGGYPGVVALMVLMAAAAATLVWRWMNAISGSSATATFAWVAVAFTGPFLFNSFTVYPEIPAALAVMAALAWPEGAVGRGALVTRALAIASLPWLSTKYAPMAVVLTGLLAWRARADRATWVAFVAPVAVSFSAWLVSFNVIWGTFAPSAPYGASTTTSIASLLRGAPGLLFDQEYGVIAHAPVLGLALVGLWKMLRAGGADARRAIEIVVVFGSLLGTVGAFHVWWGGTAAPGRPLASGLLLLGMPIAMAFQTARSASSRAAYLALLALSIAIAGALAIAENGALLNNVRDGSAAWLEWLSPMRDVTSALPSFIAGSLSSAWIRAVAWIALGVTAIWIGRQCQSGVAATVTVAFLLFGGVVLVGVAGEGPTRAVRPDQRSRVPLLDTFDASRRPLAIRYDPFTLTSPSDVLSRVSMTSSAGSRTLPQPIELLWNTRLALPAGEYRVALSMPNGQASVPATVGLQLGRAGGPIEEWSATAARSDHQFVLPIDVNFVGFRAPPALATAGGRLSVVPVRVVNARDRFDRPTVVSARRYGRTTVYFHDDLAAESSGFWTPGRSTTHVTLVTDGPAGATINLAVRCGPVANSVVFRGGAWSATIPVGAGESRTVAVPTASLPGLSIAVAPLDIDVANGFAPADHDPASKDRRVLGCWVELR